MIISDIMQIIKDNALFPCKIRTPRFAAGEFIAIEDEIPSFFSSDLGSFTSWSPSLEDLTDPGWEIISIF